MHDHRRGSQLHAFQTLQRLVILILEGPARSLFDVAFIIRPQIGDVSRRLHPLGNLDQLGFLQIARCAAVGPARTGGGHHFLNGLISFPERLQIPSGPFLDALPAPEFRRQRHFAESLPGIPPSCSHIESRGGTSARHRVAEFAQHWFAKRLRRLLHSASDPAYGHLTEPAQRKSGTGPVNCQHQGRGSAACQCAKPARECGRQTRDRSGGQGIRWGQPLAGRSAMASMRIAVDAGAGCENCGTVRTRRRRGGCLGTAAGVAANGPAAADRPRGRALEEAGRRRCC